MKTLIIDGNFFMLQVRDNLTFFDEKDKLKLAKNTANRIYDIKKQLDGIIENIIFVRDKNSWRHRYDFTIPKIFDGMEKGYKENRKHKEVDYDRKGFMDGCNYVYDRLKDLGFTVFCMDGFEGDDWMYLVKSMLKSKGYESIIYSSDGDMTMLLDEKTIYYKQSTSDKKKACYSLTHLTLGNDLGINALARATYSKPESIDVNKFVFTKCLTGDKKDNIFPVMGWTSKTNSKPFRLTETVIEKSGIELTKIDENKLYDDVFIKECIEKIAHVKNLHPTDVEVKIKELREKKEKVLTRKQTERTEKQLQKLDFEIEWLLKNIIDVDESLKCFKSNRKGLFLSKKEIPLSLLKKATRIFSEEIKLCPLSIIKENFVSKITEQNDVIEDEEDMIPF